MSAGARLARAGAVLLLIAAAAPDAAIRPVAAEPRYWTAADLDTRPQIRSHVMPEYPAELPAGLRGRVVIDLYVSTTGTLDRIRVLSAEPAGRFEQAVLKAFAEARFTPGMRQGKAVPSLVRIEVTFGD